MKIKETYSFSKEIKFATQTKKKAFSCAFNYFFQIQKYLKNINDDIRLTLPSVFKP